MHHPIASKRLARGAANTGQAPMPQAAPPVENRRNYYRLLQVQPDAAPDVIKASYRTLMQKLRFHPDLGGDEARARLINQAFAVLSDPARRALYDADRRTAQMSMGATARGRARRVESRGAGAGPAFESLPCPLCRTVNDRPVGLAGACRCHACDSPLRPVEANPLTEPGTRAVPRLNRRLRVEYRAASGPTIGHGWLEDFSSQGMRISTPRRLTPGLLLRVECELLCAVARVMRTRPHGARDYAVGMAFVTVEFANRQGGLVTARA